MKVEIEERVQRAIDLFKEGYNCSQSVVGAFADMYGVDFDTAMRMSAGFGGGVGRMRMMCGAVSGMVILAGLEHDRQANNDPENKADLYKLVQEMVHAFEEENGSIICAELLAMKGCKVVKNSHIPDVRNAEYYKVRPCAQKVASAARIFAENIMKNEE